MAKVLIVDDNPSVRMILSHWLQGQEFDVTEAEDGPAAIRCAEQMEFDFAVIDIGLPRMSGIEVCRHLLTEHLSPRPLKVWLMTGVLNAEVEAAGLAAGAMAVLGKPFDCVQLLSDLTSALEPPPQAT